MTLAPRLLPILTGNGTQQSQRPASEAGFTLATVMIGLGLATIVLTGLTLASISLQRAFAGSDQYATAQNSQLRVMDYITRDLRRAGGLNGLNAKVITAPDGSSVTFDYTKVNTGRPDRYPVALGSGTICGQAATWLMIAVPDSYDNYDSTGNPSVRSSVNSQPRDPNSASMTNGTLVYGSSPVVVTYYVDPCTSSLIRRVNWDAAGAAKQSQTIIADSIQKFDLNFATNYSWSFADQASLNHNGSYTSADIGKIALEKDNGSFWRLSAVAGTSPNATPTWVQIQPSVVQATITFAPILQRNNTNLARQGTTLNAAVILRNASL